MNNYYALCLIDETIRSVKVEFRQTADVSAILEAHSNKKVVGRRAGKYVDGATGDVRNESQSYVYLTRDETIEVGDLVFVDANDRLNIGHVVGVDDEPDIEETSKIEYKFIISKIDLSSYAKLLEETKQLIDTIRNASAKTRRAAIRQSLLGEIPLLAELVKRGSLEVKSSVEEVQLPSDG